MDKHTFAKCKLFECIGVKVGIYAPRSSHAKDIKLNKQTAGVHLDGSIERAWTRLVNSPAMSKYVASWDVMILSTTVDKRLENEIAVAISSEYFGLGNTELFTAMLLDAIKQTNKELRMISHLQTWA